MNQKHGESFPMFLVNFPGFIYRTTKDVRARISLKRRAVSKKLKLDLP